MTITKSNKHKFSLDHDKLNEKDGCTLATPYALMRSLILDSQISITPLGSCTLLHSKGVSQQNKWAGGLSWMSRKSIYSPHFKTYPLGSNSAHFGVTGRTRRYDGTRPLNTPLPSIARWPLWWLDSRLSQVHPDLTRQVPKNLLWMLSDVDRTPGTRAFSQPNRSPHCYSWSGPTRPILIRSQCSVILLPLQRTPIIGRTHPDRVQSVHHQHPVINLTLCSHPTRNLSWMKLTPTILELSLSYLVLSLISVHHT
jgi:hypothetical protein